MIALADALPTPAPRWRLVDWAERAWRRMNWRHLLLALGLQIAREFVGPLGGVFFLPVPASVDPALRFLDGSWLVGGVSIVYCVLVADEAFDDGVPALRAYGLAVVAFGLFTPVAQWLLAAPLGWPREEALAIVWWTQVLLFQGGLGTAIYAYWRVTQRSLRRAQAAETERLRNEQRVQTSRLLALQSRVEPQMLFDALGRVASLHLREPQAADSLLADLIALLRAMQPHQTTDNSTVEREFALVEAWIRVSRSAEQDAPRIHLQAAPEARALSIAPMLILPLLRAALALPQATARQWELSADAAGSRLVITLRASTGTDLAGASASAELASLRDRISRLFGRSAGLAVLPHLPALTLDLPRLQEDADDDSPDR